MDSDRGKSPFLEKIRHLMQISNGAGPTFSPEQYLSIHPHAFPTLEDYGHIDIKSKLVLHAV